MRRIALICAALLTVGVMGATQPPVSAAPTTLQGTIISWADGDTVRVRVQGVSTRVRLIGIDAPEARASERASRQAAEMSRDMATVVTLGRRARAAAERLAPAGRRVRLEQDVRTHDRFGRLLAYVWLADGRMVNEELVRRGFAMVLTIPPNVRYTERFLAAQREARAARRGLWGRP
jgi:micrococcal nuclease